MKMYTVENLEKTFMYMSEIRSLPEDRGRKECCEPTRQRKRAAGRPARICCLCPWCYWAAYTGRTSTWGKARLLGGGWCRRTDRSGRWSPPQPLPLQPPQTWRPLRSSEKTGLVCWAADLAEPAPVGQLQQTRDGLSYCKLGAVQYRIISWIL